MSQPVKLSFEFFPPKTAQGEANLQTVWRELNAFEPEFFSVTYGAGGSTQNKTLSTVLALHQDIGAEIAPHISCVSGTRESLRALINEYQRHNIKRLVVLRGDLPSGMGVGGGEFRYAQDLVRFIRVETGDQFHIEVAAYPEMHPEGKSLQNDLHHLKAKVDAGANSAITQYFFNVESYCQFIDDCQKLNIDVPVIPGLMPITNLDGLVRFSKMCEADLPRWLVKRLQGFGDDHASLRAYGVDVVSRLAQSLIAQGAPGIHLYTLNQLGASKSICERVFA